MADQNTTPNGAGTITVELTREQAHAAAVALADDVIEQAEHMLASFGEPGSGTVQGLEIGACDAQAHARRLTQQIAALEAIGWPQTHAWPDCDLSGSDDRGPWGPTPLSKRHESALAAADRRLKEAS